MARRFTQIKGLSENRRLPRMGKIRLGIRIKKKAADNRCKHEKNETCNFCTYPKETEYFVVPPEVAKVYGEKPTELDIMLPVNDLNIIFPQAYEMYGSGRGLFCSGDGETAIRLNKETKSFDERKCPCEYLEQKKCSQRAHLLAILPKVSPGGVYQFDTGSINSIIDINSSLEFVQAMIGRFAMVQLKIKRIPTQTHHDGKKQTHYTMKIEPVGDIGDIKLLRNDKETIFLLPEPPEHVNPEVDGPTFDEQDGESETPPAQAEAPAKEPAKKAAPAKPAEKPPIDGQAERVPEKKADGPTKDELLRKIKESQNSDDLNQCLADAAHLSEDDSRAVRMAVIARGREVANQRAAS
jgi:hypothetical protein